VEENEEEGEEEKGRKDDDYLLLVYITRVTNFHLQEKRVKLSL
jgi:hypothetical protein